MPHHPDINGSHRDPDSFPSHYRDRNTLPRGDFRHFRERHLPPSVRQGDILQDLKGRLRSGPSGADMFFNDCFFTPDAMFAKADEGEDAGGTLRGRHPHMHPQAGFHVPTWVSDQDMSDLAARMSHAPHFATMGRRGVPGGVGGAGVPWRERRHSGGSAMSVVSDDGEVDRMQGVDQTVPHEIPIRFEAPPPPSLQPQGQGQAQHLQGHPQGHPQGPPQQQQQQQEGQDRPPQCPVRTTSAVDATEHSNTGAPRNSRCASAPPEMAEQQQQQHQQQQQQQEAPSQQQQQQPQRFVSKINITPQAPASPQTKASPPFSPLPAKFNTVPRPFVPGEQQQQQQQQQYPPQQQQQQYPPQQQQYQYQQYPQFQGYQQPPMGFFPPADAQWQYQQQYPPQQAQQEAPAQQQRGGAGGSGGGSGQRPSVVRNIPIFVEGRDEPLEQEAKPQQQWTQQRHAHHPQQPTPQQHPQVPQPPPPPPPQTKSKQRRQQAQSHQATPPPHPVPIPMPDSTAPPQQDTAPPQPQTQTQGPPPPPPPPQPQQDRRITEIERVKGTVAGLRERVDIFKGGKKDREFLYLDEMLTRALLQLDNIDPDGCDEVRQARRGVIKDINGAITKLESLAKDVEVPKESNSAGEDVTAKEPQGEEGKKEEEEGKGKEEEEVVKEEEKEKEGCVQEEKKEEKEKEVPSAS